MVNERGFGHRISPIIYNPDDYSDGSRFRLIKYYPHPSDELMCYGMSSAWGVDLGDDSSINCFAIETELYYSLFYDEQGVRKYSSTYGEPYAPSVDYIIPYEYPLDQRVGDGVEQGHFFNMILHGIIREI